MVAGAMKDLGFMVPALDILYWDDWRLAKLHRGQPMPENNPMDCNQPSGFALLWHAFVLNLSMFSLGSQGSI